MKQFLKFTFASIVGFFISIFLISVLFFLFTFAIISSIDKTESVTVSDNTVLEIQFDYELPERTNTNPGINYSIVPSIAKTLGLNDVKRIIKNAKSDARIKGIYLNLDNFFLGSLTKIQVIRKSLIDFKSSGKFIIAHGNTINERAFYLATAADSIFLSPTGTIEFNGFGIEVSFFKGLLEKLEVEPQIFQYGKFKSATEPFRLDKLSNDNRLQLSNYLNSVHNNYLMNVSQATDISIDTLKFYSENLRLNSAESAFDNGFIDELLYQDQVDSVMNKLLNSTEVKKISFKKYFNALDSPGAISKNRIAVIYALGEILENSGDEYTIGKENIIRSIRDALNNSRVKAIVMRVNSPGGSPLTSDMIWREIELASEIKPFIVSMGDMAASGGYYISCNADLIVAEPSTLAGSIGVYGIIPNTKKFFNNKLGITFDKVETNENSNLFSLTNPLSETQKAAITDQIDNIYFDFVNRVAEGRDMTFDEVDKIAQGRIWSGLDAKEIGLVDTLGGLELAIKIASEKADIYDYKIIEYPTQKEAFEKIMEMFTTEIKSIFISEDFEYPLNQIEKLKNALKYSGIQARLPFDYSIN